MAGGKKKGTSKAQKQSMMLSYMLKMVFYYTFIYILNKSSNINYL